MSRIDRAIRIREGNAAATESDDANAAPATPLQQYERERRQPAIKESRPRATPAIEPAAPGEPAPGLLARAHTPAPGGARTARTRRPSITVDADRRARLVTGTSSMVSVEQYRKVAAALHEEQVRSQLKTVIITSALPGEGKTLTVVNLALTLSESYGRRVLIVDADLRGPSLHAALNIPNNRGLSEALNDGQLTIVQVSSEFAVLTAGSPGPSPLAALTSDRMAHILEECASQFDWVLIDTPPIGVLPDAQVLVRLAGAVIFVIGAGTTPAATVEKAIAELGGPDAIFGVVMNRVDERRIPSASYYGHYKNSSS